jgi:hypothetical protein
MESFENGIYLVSIKTEQMSIVKPLDPVLNLKEVVAYYEGDVLIGHKVGDGVSKWSELKFVDKISDIRECWLYVPDNDNPGKMRVAGKILLDPGYKEW